MGHILRASIQGNPNVGLFGFATDSFCILGREVPSGLAKEIGETLQVPVHRLTAAGTSLIGVFITGTEKKLLVPSILFAHELAELEKIAPVHIIDTKLTALGNNILCNSKGCLISTAFEEKAREQIIAAMGSAKVANIGEIEVIGSCVATTKTHAYGHPEMTFEQEFIETSLGVKLTKGTVAMGSPYVKSGILVNKNGFVAGSTSTGIEMSQIDEAFGFLVDDA